MNCQVIEVVISSTGETRVETKGFAGSTCRQASQFLEQTLGAKLGESLTAEFHVQEPAQNRIQQGDAA